MKLEEVKRNLNKMVVLNGKKGIYRLTACIIRKDKNGYYYQVELLDTKHGNSIMFCGLDDITEEE